MNVFFAFDRTLDASRADLLRQIWDGPDRGSRGFCDDFTWASVQKGGPEGVAAWVRGELADVDVVAVLVGAETHLFRHVQVAIDEAAAGGLGLVGVRVHQIPDAAGHRSMPGPDPLFAHHGRVFTHDWMPGFSDRFLSDWVFVAADRAGRV